MVRIEFEKGVAREMKEEDIPKLVNMTQSDEDIQRFYFVSPKLPVEEHWQRKFARIEKAIANPQVERIEYNLVIEHKGEVKGALDLWVEDFRWDPPRKQKMAVGYFIGKDYRGNGIASAVVRSTVPFVFGEFDASALVADCHEANSASAKILKREGFQEIGYKNPLFSNAIFRIYSMLYAEYASRNQNHKDLNV